jgi:hypothetical protein
MQRKRPLNDKYRKVCEGIVLKGLPVTTACKEAGLTTKSWYVRYQEPEIQALLAELETLKSQRKPEDESVSKTVKKMAFDIIIDGLKKGDLKTAELVIRNLDKFEGLDGKEFDLSAIYELMYEAGISLDQIKIPDEPEI